jgi:hypothetical protein
LNVTNLPLRHSAFVMGKIEVKLDIYQPHAVTNDIADINNVMVSGLAKQLLKYCVKDLEYGHKI